jgi:hypothetical protein
VADLALDRVVGKCGANVTFVGHFVSPLGPQFDATIVVNRQQRRVSVRSR